jgi:uncharacterized protein
MPELVVFPIVKWKLHLLLAFAQERDLIISMYRFTVLYERKSLVAADGSRDCACPTGSQVADSVPVLSNEVVQSHPYHHLLLTPEYTLAFRPSHSRVVVLNRSALDFLERLRTPQTLYHLDEEERDAAQQLYAAGLLQIAGQEPAPPPPPDELVAWLHVTNACNLRCSYCYIDKTDEAMSAETGVAAIDTVLRTAHLHGYRKVSLKYAGGEASLNLSRVAAMQRYARKQARAGGIELRGVVLSNGVGLTRTKLECIRDLGLHLMISLDGLPEFHDVQRPRRGGQGSFTAVRAAIERAKDLGLPLTVSVTVTGASVDGLPAIVGWLLEREIHFSLNFYRECDAGAGTAALQLDAERLIAGMRAAYQVVAQRLPRYSLLGCLLDRTNAGAAHTRTCVVGENYLVIDHHGRVAKCQMELARPVTTVREHDPLTVIRQDQTGVQNLPVDQKEGCRACAWKYWCAGGCAVAAFRTTGRYDIQSPNCEIYQALFPELLRLEGLRLLHWAQRA